MNKHSTSYIGLDVHKDSIAVAVAEPGRKPPRFVGTVTTVPSSLTKSLLHVADKAHAHIVYEAGPSGYGWARYLRSQGWDCDVIAPSHINRCAADKRIKTDRRDALLLAKESRAGNLVSIVVPDARDEAIRDLARTRADAVSARLRARLQLQAMLLRHGRNYNGKCHWTRAHERHLASVRFDHPAQDIAFNEYRQAVTSADEALKRLTEALDVQCREWRMRPLVEAIMCLRGFDTIAATTFVAEIGDLTRFAKPASLMAYLGLVPSEYSSGASRSQGSITKTGNKHARRILVEAAWNYRHKAHVSRELQIRQQGQPKVIRDIAWKAQLRLAQRYYRHLRMGRKLHQNKVCIAIARELAGFIWDIGRHVELAEQ
ncbi:MAG: IS110 family transposase [Parahaliea sp.]